MRHLLLWPSWLWLLGFVLAPAALLAVIALATPVEAAPPYVPGFSLEALHAALTDPLYREAFLGSLRIGAVSALFCLLIGTPMALAIARAPAPWRGWLLMLVMLPFWSGFLLRILAWISILRDEGVLNSVLLWLGVIAAPLRMLNTDFAMYVGIVYCYLPFLVLPVQARLASADPLLEQAAADLGASPFRVLCHVALPLALPGILAGLVLVFVPVTGEYVIPALLGGPGSLTIGRVIWDEFFENHDWPQAASLALVLLAVLLAPTFAMRRPAAAARQ